MEYFDHYGRRYKVLAVFDEADTAGANAFMAANENAALLVVHAGKAILADQNDQGVAIRLMKCSVCGGNAGKHAQHWNRDTGWGLCTGCCEWLVGRRTGPEEMKDLYGEPGLNYTPPDH